MGIGLTIDPEEVGSTGLFWLFFSYGYALFYAANLIGEGSELLLLVPSMAGLVGGVVLPLLGAVPDGAIILFSGMGSIEEAQETLSVGVGALAGSTIMLLTVPWALSVFAGRVDLSTSTNNNNGSTKQKPTGYKSKPKLTTPRDSLEQELEETGVSISDEVSQAGIVMAITTIPYFLIQVPALFLHGPTEEVAKGEHWWALAGFIVCLIGLVYYMKLQLQFSKEGQDRDKRIAVTKKILQEGKVSLSGALRTTIEQVEHKLDEENAKNFNGEYNSLMNNNGGGGPGDDGDKYSYPPPEIAYYLREIFMDTFKLYDHDRSGSLERSELRVFFKDFHETIEEEDIDLLLSKADANSDGCVSFDEFIGLAYNLIKSRDELESGKAAKRTTLMPGEAKREVIDSIWKGDKSGKSGGENDQNGNNGEEDDDDDDDDQDEEEEIPADFTELSPEEQQKAIKLRAFKMLSIRTVLVLYFSDPMVDVMQEIAVRVNMSPFYVSFILAPLASNASEVVASMYYASKKTRKTISVSLSALEGAASMNNTFCLSIFMSLIFLRGLAWQYTAETLAIVIVEFIMAYMVQDKVMTAKRALIVLSIFPMSLVLVAFLEYIGLD